MSIAKGPGMTSFTYTNKGFWNASSGSAPESSPTAGDLYVVSTAGTYALNSYPYVISQWYVGDQVVWLGSNWYKINGVNRDVPSVLDWGADPTGTNDSTSVINAALAFMLAAGGGELLFPPGTYLHSGLTINSAGPSGLGYLRLRGLGGRALDNTATDPGVRLVCSSATNDHLYIYNCNCVEIDNIGFFGEAGQTFTAGYAVHVKEGQRFSIRNFYIGNAYNGLWIDGVDVPIIENGDIENLASANGVVGMVITGASGTINQGRVDRLFVDLTPGGTPPTGSIGIYIQDGVNSITWVKVGVSYADTGLKLGSQSGDGTLRPSFHRFYDLAVENCAIGVDIFDGTDCWFNNLYACKGGIGVIVEQTMDTNDIHDNPLGGPMFFDNPRIDGNQYHGVELLGSPWVCFTGGTVGDNGGFASNTYNGFHITSQSAFFSICGTRVGGNINDQPDMTGAQQYGIYISPASGGSPTASFIIDDVNALGNMTGALYDGSPITANKYIGTILGFPKTSANLPNVTSLPNVLVNGAFQVWQRGTMFAFGNNISTADFWICRRGSNNANGTLTQMHGGPTGVGGTGSSQSTYFARLGRTNGDTNLGFLSTVQILTSADSIPLIGQTVVLTFFARAGGSFSGSSLNSRIILGTGTDQTATQLVGAGWTNQLDIGQVNSFASGGAWQLFTQWVSLPVSVSGTSYSQIAVEFYYTPSGTAGAYDYVDLALVSLQGSYAPSVVEIRPFWLDMAAAQRRFRKSFPYATAPAQNTGATAGAAYVRLTSGQSGTFGVQVPLLPPMRAAPTVTTFNPDNSNANWRDTTNNADRTVTVGDIADSGFRVDGASGVATSANFIHWTADAELL
jgi:hypothetical protein